MTAAQGDTAWQRLRYGPLLTGASRSFAGARAYASLVAAVEYRRDRTRRRVAQDRIARWLGTSADEAGRVFRASLFSEALEEADSSRHMRLGANPADSVDIEGVVPRAGRPRIYGALHFGSPVLAFMGLRAQFEPDVRVIARELDRNNPMPQAKTAFARRKVAWVEETSGAPFFDTDDTAILHAREHLLAGRPLFAAVDVPGDVVDRSDRVALCGESIVLASGIFRLAAMTGADMQMVVSVQRGDRVLVHCRPPVDGQNAAALEAAMVVEMEAVIRQQPDEWWFWPFVLSHAAGTD